jgi:hypothetical protein
MNIKRTFPANGEWNRRFHGGVISKLLATVQAETVIFLGGVEPVFPGKTSGHRLCGNPSVLCTGEIRVLDSTGKLERTIAFDEADRKL